MKSDSLQPQPTSRDRTLLRQTLLKLTATQKIVCVVVVAVVAIVWYDLLNRLVAFGRDMDYSGLKALGVQAVALLKQYNPFFWWTVVALCTLIIAYFLYGFIQSTRRSVRAKIVSEQTLGTLVDQLSHPAREVLIWAWADHRDPITVGDLQRASHELHSGRAAKIQLARRHEAMLAATRSATDPSDHLPSV